MPSAGMLLLALAPVLVLGVPTRVTDTLVAAPHDETPTTGKRLGVSSQDVETLREALRDELVGKQGDDAPPMCHAATTEPLEGPCVAKIIAVDGDPVMPLPPTDYPEGMTGLLWMDQLGVMTPNLPKLSGAAPDLLFSFGDPELPLDRTTRSIKIDLSGPYWQWYNSVDGMRLLVINRQKLCFYQFAFNEDYTAADIVKHYKTEHKRLFRGPYYTLSPSAYNMFKFTMERQKTPPPGACPPAADADDAAMVACATWVRKTSLLVPGTSIEVPLPTFLKNYIGFPDYYVYQVVDANGAKIEPFYSAYLKLAQTSSSEPISEADAAQYGYTATQYNASGTSIVGTTSATKAALAKYAVE